MCLNHVSVEVQQEVGDVLGLFRLALWPPTTFPGLADMMMLVGEEVVVIVERVVRTVGIADI
jgi:hypothetical protein